MYAYNWVYNMVSISHSISIRKWGPVRLTSLLCIHGIPGTLVKRGDFLYG